MGMFSSHTLTAESRECLIGLIKTGTDWEAVQHLPFLRVDGRRFPLNTSSWYFYLRQCGLGRGRVNVPARREVEEVAVPICDPPLRRPERDVPGPAPLSGAGIQEVLRERERGVSFEDLRWQRFSDRDGRRSRYSAWELRWFVARGGDVSRVDLALARRYHGAGASEKWQELTGLEVSHGGFPG